MAGGRQSGSQRLAAVGRRRQAAVGRREEVGGRRQEAGGRRREAGGRRRQAAVGRRQDSGRTAAGVRQESGFVVLDNRGLVCSEEIFDCVTWALHMHYVGVRWVRRGERRGRRRSCCGSKRDTCSMTSASAPIIVRQTSL